MTAKRAHVTKYIVLGLLLCNLAIWLSPTSMGQAAPLDLPGTMSYALAHAPAQALQTGGNNIDVVIVLDNSGSMGTCSPWQGKPIRREPCDPGQSPPSDPKDLRFSAARLLVQLADDNDRIALVGFDANTEAIGSEQMESVGGPDKRRNLIGSIQPPNDYTGRGYTRIDLGLQRAAEILNQTKRERPTYILFLTDGEPTQPDHVPAQDGPVIATMDGLRKAGVQVFPVALCNNGCPDDFLTRTMGRPARAQDANSLLQVFSTIFSKMKPTLHVVGSDAVNADGNVEFSTSGSQGAYQLNIVATKGDLQSLHHNGAMYDLTSGLDDGNISVDVAQGNPLPDGTWTLKTSSRQGFVVARTTTYPDLIFPPPSVPDNPASARISPRGKQSLLVAKIEGPGGNEPILLNGTGAMEDLTSDGIHRFARVTDVDESVSLQVGQQARPLKIVRDFPFEQRDNLPVLQLPQPQCSAGEPCEIKSVFAPGSSIQDVSATLYIAEIGKDNKEKPVLSNVMQCADRECTDNSFTPEDGKTYMIRALAQASSGGITFGVWEEGQYTMDPAVYVRGLPNPLDLKTQPSDGWPVTIVAGTTEDLGRLQAGMTLTRKDDGSPAEGVQLQFPSLDIRGRGEQQTVLRVDVPPALRPGQYEGRITFTLSHQQDVLLVPTEVSVGLVKQRPGAKVLSTSLDFGEQLYDASPNFRLEREETIDIEYSDRGFPLKVMPETSTCEGLSVTTDSPQQQEGGQYSLKLHMRSDRPLQPATCSGTLTLAAPTGDYEVEGGKSIPWEVTVRQVEWSIIGMVRNDGIEGDVQFGTLGEAGERSQVTLAVRYSGTSPFKLQLRKLEGTDASGSTQITEQDVELVTEVTSSPDPADGMYKVPVELVTRRKLPDNFSGTEYSGKMQLGIEGLSGDALPSVSYSFRNPNLFERQVSPYYRLMWPGLLCWPLTLFTLPLLFIFARIRRVNRDDELAEELIVQTPGQDATGPRRPPHRPYPGGQVSGPRAIGKSKSKYAAHPGTGASTSPKAPGVAARNTHTSARPTVPSGGARALRPGSARPQNVGGTRASPGYAPGSSVRSPGARPQASPSQYASQNRAKETSRGAVATRAGSRTGTRPR